MFINREPLYSWFGFTRRERRSSTILLVILLLIIILRYIVPERNIETENFQTGFSVAGSASGTSDEEDSAENRLFAFDPNTASYDTLMKLGFTQVEANTLIRYRSRGGRFRKPSDIFRIYGVDSGQAAKVIPFIVISDHASGTEQHRTRQTGRQRMDINSCDSSSLVSLPGIGPVLSGRIVKYRHLLGGFARTDQLKEVYGLPPETYDLIKNNIYADSAAIIRIMINSADFKTLRRMPYFENYEVTAILKYRELKGKIADINNLVDNNLITREKAKKLLPYLSFD